MTGATVDIAVNETDQNLNPLWNEAANGEGGGQDKYINKLNILNT